MKIRIGEMEIVIEDEKDVSLVEKLLSKLDRGKKEKKEIEAVMALSKPYQRVIEAIKRAELGKCYKVREIYKMAGYSGEVVGGWFYQILDIFALQGYLRKVFIGRKRHVYCVVEKPE